MYAICLGLSAGTFLLFALYFSRQPGFNIYHPLSIYAAFHLLIFVIRPIVAYLEGFTGIYLAFRFTPSIEVKSTVILASNLGFVLFAAASLYTGNVAMRFNQTARDLAERRVLRRSFGWVWLVLGPLALYSVLSSLGGPGAGMMLDRATGVAYNTTTNGYATDAQIMFISLAAILAWIYRFRLLAMLPLIIYCLYRATTGYRVMMVLAVLLALIFYAFDRKLARPNWLTVLLGAALAMSFVYIGADRGQRVRETLGIDGRQSASYTSVDSSGLAGMDFGNMEFFEYIVWVVPEKSGTYDYFLDNAQVFTEPVPRKLWSGKPFGEPFNRVSLFAYGTPFGITRSLPGEGWYAFGWLGVVLWCVLWGGLLGTAYRKFAEGPKTPLRVASYFSLLIVLVPFYRDGQLLTLVRLAGPVLVPCAAWALFARWSGARAALDTERQPGSLASGEPAPARARHPRSTLPPAVARRRAALAQGNNPAD